MDYALPDVSIRQLEYLLAVADHATFAEAASTVGVSASALSQGLAELERRVGVPVFERDGRRRSIRHEARPVVEHARQVVALTTDLMLWSSELNAAGRGRVRVGMIDVAAVHHLSDTVRRFAGDHPNVELALSVAPSGALLDDLRAGNLDVIVCTRPPRTPAGIELTSLLNEPLYVIAPPGTDIGVDLARWGPWLTFPVGSHTREHILECLRKLGASTEVVAESHQPDVLIQMVRMGLGWTVLAVHERTDIADVAVGRELLHRELIVARRSGAVVAPAVEAFIELIDGAEPKPDIGSA